MLTQTKVKEALAMPNQIVLDFPTELPIESWQDKAVFQKGKETIILELLRKSIISQGKAAELLGISRYDLFDLMANYNIPMANFEVEELNQELQTSKEEPAPKGKWAKVAERMSNEGFLTGKSGEEFSRLSKEFRENFVFKNSLVD